MTFEEELCSNREFCVRLAMKLVHNKTKAEDYTQETLMRAWAARDKFLPGSNMKAWLAVILRNFWFSEIRRSKVHERFIEGRTRETAQNANQVWAIRLKQALEGMKNMSPDMVNAVVLVACGHSYEDAAAMEGVALGTMKSRVSRGRKQLSSVY